MKKKFLILTIIGGIGAIFLIGFFVWNFVFQIPDYTYQELKVAHVSYDDLINHRSDLQYENWSGEGAKDATPLYDILVKSTYRPLNELKGQEILSKKKDENVICAIRRSNSDVRVDSNAWIFLDLQVIQMEDQIYLIAEGKLSMDSDPVTTVFQADNQEAIQKITDYYSVEKPDKISTFALFCYSIRHAFMNHLIAWLGGCILLTVVAGAVLLLRRQKKRR